MTLTRKTPLKPSPIKRRTKRLPWRSAKRKGIADERRELVARLLSDRPTCEAMSHLRLIVRDLGDEDQRIVVDAMRACSIRSTEVHEVLSRARGGSILDESNCLSLCHNCHAWVTTHPWLATKAGLLKSRWQR